MAIQSLLMPQDVGSIFPIVAMPLWGFNHGEGIRNTGRWPSATLRTSQGTTGTSSVARKIHCSTRSTGLVPVRFQPLYRSRVMGWGVGRTAASRETFRSEEVCERHRSRYNGFCVCFRSLSHPRVTGIIHSDRQRVQLCPPHPNCPRNRAAASHHDYRWWQNIWHSEFPRWIPPVRWYNRSLWKLHRI